VSTRIAVPIALVAALLLGLAAAGACTMMLALTVARGAERVVSSVGGSRAGSSSRVAVTPSAQARADIPPLYLALYMQAGARFGLNWAILAGIGRVECDHGRDPAPSCTVEGQFNYAGAGGPAQFLSSTWQRYGITPSGQGTPDMWRPSDAIFSMANYLRACGAPGDYSAAIYCYNHAWWYVAEVLSWARLYSGRYGSAPGPPRNDGAVAMRRPRASARTRGVLSGRPGAMPSARRDRNIDAARGS
jgi:Transglycosylase SLT domain